MRSLILAALLLASCAAPQPPQPAYTQQTDTCLYDEVFFRCLSMAQNVYKAVNDGSVAWSTAEIKCSNIAYSSSARNSTKVAARCTEWP